MVGHGGGPAHGAEEDGVHARELGLPVVGHHLAVFGVVVAVGPVEMVELQRQVEAPGCGFQRAQAFGHDFLADAVAGDDCNLFGSGHGALS
jgi:hypothetical protein